MDGASEASCLTAGARSPANPGTADYGAAKAGLVMMMKVLAMELAPQNIRVSTIHPTTVNTDMILNEVTYRLLPISAVEVEDISNAVLYLVPDDGRYVTGSTHVIDAGSQL